MADGLACACINGRYCYEGGRPTRCWLRDGKPVQNYPQQLVREEAERLAEKEDRTNEVPEG